MTNSEKTGAPSAGDSGDGVVRNLISGKPFRTTAMEYVRRGWIPFPLPPGQKHPPATGATGKKHALPGSKLGVPGSWRNGSGFDPRAVAARVQAYLENKGALEGTDAGADWGGGENLGLRMRYDVVGIDVDHYDNKRGGDDLRELEQRLGKLPRTWVSSARLDGKSGTRFFRLPKKYLPSQEEDSIGGLFGLSFSGKAAKAIDVIQFGHRYHMAAPSWHADLGNEVRWFTPDEPLDAVPTGYRTKYEWSSHEEEDGDFAIMWAEVPEVKIPDVSELPFLPKSWIDYLSRGFSKDDAKPRDITSTERDLLNWAAENFSEAQGTACKSVRKASGTWDKRMREGESSHDKILEMHWNILRYGIEGHRGVLTEAQRLEDLWLETVLKGNEINKGSKRHVSEAKSEIFRSRVEALRKIKGSVDEAEELGANLLGTRCTCFEDTTGSSGGGEESSGEVKTDLKDPGEYERNDDGNGQHLTDLYGDDLHFVPALDKWILWNGKIWLRGETEAVIRRCYRKVKERQYAYANHLFALADEARVEMEDSAEIPLNKDGTERKNGRPTYDAELKHDADSAFKKAVEWKQWAERSGDNVRANGAIRSAKANPNVEIDENLLDADPTKLGVLNGVITLGSDGVTFGPAQREDLVTLNTGTPFISLRDQIQGSSTAGIDGEKLREGAEAWKEYLDLFLPDPELRRFTQKAMGYSLLGENPEKLIFFLKGPSDTGKSTMLECVMSATGGYSNSVDMNIFRDRASGLNPALAQALPMRIITASEASSDKALHDDVFKRITGGDHVSAELKGVNVIIRRVPNFTAIIATNAVPSIPNAGEATLRRICTIPFMEQHRHESGGKVHNLARRVRIAVLAWLIEGYALYAKEGLDYKDWPLAVRAETKNFGHEVSDLLEWTSRTFEKVPTPPGKGVNAVDKEGAFTVPVERAYQQYVTWASDQGAQVMTPHMFGRKMTSLGFVKGNVRYRGGNAMRCYVGVILREDPKKFSVRKSGSSAANENAVEE